MKATLGIFLILMTSIAGATSRDPATSAVPLSPIDGQIAYQVPPPPRIDQPAPQDGRKFPRIWFGSIRWEQPIDPIELSVAKDLAPIGDYRYTFQLIPQLRSPSNQVKELPDGYYVVRMVLLRPIIPGLDDEAVEAEEKYPGSLLYRRYVAGSERLAQVIQGSIRTTMDFHFHTLSATTLRNTLLIQILPVNPKSLKRNTRGLIIDESSYELEKVPSYYASVIRIPFIPRYASGLSTPPNTLTQAEANPEEDLNLGIFMKTAELLNKPSRIAVTPQNYATDAKLKYLSLDDSRIPSDLAKAIRDIRQSEADLPETLVETFCKMLAPAAVFEDRILGPGSESQKAGMARIMREHITKKCIEEPETSLNLVEQIHVGSLDKVAQLRGAPSRLNLTANFAINRQRTNDVHSSYSAGISPVNLYGISAGYSYTINESNSRINLRGKLTSEAIDLDIHFWEMAMTLKKYTSCLRVEANPRSEVWKYVKSTEGFYICDRPETTPLPVKERYFHIFPSTPSSPTIDLFDPRNQLVNMVLRGGRDYAKFIHSIQGLVDPTTKDLLSHEPLLDERLSTMSAPPSMPSLLTYTVGISGPKVEKRIRVTATKMVK